MPHRADLAAQVFELMAELDKDSEACVIRPLGSVRGSAAPRGPSSNGCTVLAAWALELMGELAQDSEGSARAQGLGSLLRGRRPGARRAGLRAAMSARDKEVEASVRPSARKALAASGATGGPVLAARVFELVAEFARARARASTRQLAEPCRLVARKAAQRKEQK